MGVGTGVGVGDGVGFGVGLGVGFGVACACGCGFGFGVAAGLGLTVGFGVALTVVPHLSAKSTVHIFLPSAPLYDPTPIASQLLPRMLARWPDEPMNIWWIWAVASSSGYVFQPMFSPATL